jgi:hypothetical protein
METSQRIAVEEMHMEQLVLSALVIQGIWALAVFVRAATDAVTPSVREPRYWTAPPTPVRVFAESVYDLHESSVEESYPRAA